MSAKYDKIGVGYDFSRKADPFLLERMFELLRPDKNRLYLDIGCGTGNYTGEFSKKGFQFIGIDTSSEMLDKAKSKDESVDWRIGRAEEIDLGPGSIDGALISLTLHHWLDLKKGFDEVNRVLKENGRALIFSPTLEQTEKYWLAHYFPRMIEKSANQLPSFKRIQDVLLNSGFEILKTEPYSVRPDLQDLFLYSGKHNPELYFNPKIRNGISSFASLADKDEIERGLANLRRDIDSGKINSIIESFQHTLGDYLFILAEKRKC